PTTPPATRTLPYALPIYLLEHALAQRPGPGYEGQALVLALQLHAEHLAAHVRLPSSLRTGAGRPSSSMRSIGCQRSSALSPAASATAVRGRVPRQPSGSMCRR